MVHACTYQQELLQALDALELGGGMKKHGLHPGKHALEVLQQVQQNTPRRWQTLTNDVVTLQISECN